VTRVYWKQTYVRYRRQALAREGALQGGGSRSRAPVGMDAGEWLGLIAGAVRAHLSEVEISRPDDDMLTLALGTRGVVLRAVGATVILAPSFAAGGTIGSRLADRVQHLEMTSYAMSKDTIVPVADAVVGHLR
jgi:hypothetical protein